MPDQKLSTGLRATLAILTVTVLVASATAATGKVLHKFNNKDGANPAAGLTFDAAGNLYGTTFAAGAYGGGTVFELTPKAGGGWAEKVLHQFGKGKDGSGSEAGLILDASGNLYGTTFAGGAYGGGTVFELLPETGRAWKEHILHSFGNGEDGINPEAGVIFDAAGNLYGTTYVGGFGVGTVFELTPKTSGGWTEEILHNFGGGYDGYWPVSGVIFDTSGNLYGTTSAGGTGGTYAGTVFELTPKAGGGWKEKVLYDFNANGHGGNTPLAGLILDGSGNLYGTTYWGPLQGYGGPCNDGYYLGCGIVFELMPKAGGGWTEKTLHYFATSGDGYLPAASLILDTSGNLYGTTGGGDGAVFELTPKPNGSWTEKILHYFVNGNEGIIPLSGLIFDGSGNLYGTTFYGGNSGCNDLLGTCGTVFEITP
jgi:uncharacterized repeat protein (TIGR03803 family)